MSNYSNKSNISNNNFRLHNTNCSNKSEYRRQ